MEARQDGGKKARRIFTPEQKFEILKDIERCQTIKEGLTKHQLDTVTRIIKSQNLITVRRPAKTAVLAANAGDH